MLIKSARGFKQAHSAPRPSGRRVADRNRQVPSQVGLCCRAAVTSGERSETNLRGVSPPKCTERSCVEDQPQQRPSCEGHQIIAALEDRTFQPLAPILKQPHTTTSDVEASRGRASVLECACPPAFAARQSAASARRRLALWNPSSLSNAPRVSSPPKCTPQKHRCAHFCDIWAARQSSPPSFGAGIPKRPQSNKVQYTY